jgi:uncharacterized membrane protein
MNRLIGSRDRVEQLMRRYRDRGEQLVRRNVAWNRLFHGVSYVRSSLWVIPLLSIVAVLMFGPILRWLDTRLGWRIAGLGIAGATALYQTVITLSLSFLVFTFGSLLVAIQVASGQLTPRIIATTLLRDNVVRYSVGLFVFTLVFSVMALDRLESRVHEMVAFVTSLLGIGSMVMFLFLIDYAARLLRPVSILTRVGNQGVHVIQSMYPALHSEGSDDLSSPLTLTEPERVFRHAGPAGIVLAVDREALIAAAERVDGLIECVPHVGDFVSTDEPLLNLFGGAARISNQRLRATVALGAERTMEQDPLFAFRIVADIALKALSPAINDPTTAVLAVDQIHRLLRVVGWRRLSRETLDDRRGRPRLIYRTPNWQDYVHVSCNEIRLAGAGSTQVARRLRAMLDNLIATLPPTRHAALVRELELLDASIDDAYRLPADAALARVADSQGLGASRQARRSEVP